MRVLATVAFATVIAGGLCVPQEAHVKYNRKTKELYVQKGPSTGDAVAWSSFDDQVHNTGFAYLEVSTNSSYKEIHQSYAAGLLEGHLTKSMLSMHYNNTMRDYCDGQERYCKKLKLFLQMNLNFVNRMIKKNRRRDPYWFQTELALSQLRGVQDGWTGSRDDHYKADHDGFKSITPVLFMNVDGDLEDLEQALSSPKMRLVRSGGHCSALVKVLPDLSDIYVSQVTWNTYSSMLRILKKYSFNYRQAPSVAKTIPGATVTFSSSPGKIFSGDDFHLLSSGLVSMETTIGNSNPALWKHITPQSNLEWMRTIVANRLAINGSTWYRLFDRYHSGTYNNEWMIVDYKKFTPGKPIQPGTLMIINEIPAWVFAGDQSALLAKQTYWPSYNIPFHRIIYTLSGWPEKVKKYGDWFSYDHSPRANIFRRDHVKVKDMDSMLKLMRYNDYQHDEFSKCNCTPPYSAENAIAARCDLNPANGTYPFGALGHRSHGATDAKITNFSLFKNLEFLAVSGPTHDPLPPFQWSTSGLSDLHEGHPDLWVFAPHVHHWTK